MKLSLLQAATANVEGPWISVLYPGHYVLSVDMTGDGSLKIRRRITGLEVGGLVQLSDGTDLTFTASGETELVFSRGYVRAEITGMTTGTTTAILQSVPPNSAL